MGKKRRGRPQIRGEYIAFKCPDDLYAYVRSYGLNARQDDNWSAALRQIIEEHMGKLHRKIDTEIELGNHP